MEKTILIIEDDNFLQGLEAMKLKKEGYNVVAASNSVDAFKTIETEKSIDLILLDILLPGEDGFMVLEKIRLNEKVKSTPVIIFSNLSEEADKDKAVRFGIEGFMVKSNFTLDELADKIKTLFVGKK